MKNWESSKYRNRSGWSYSSDSFRTTILKGGGHIAELTMLNTKSGDINPLWSVPWDSIEPEDYEKYIGSGKYEDPPTGKAHASIMGHNLCLDTYCTPSEAEQKIGLGHHGEAPVANWDKTDSGPNYLIVEAQLTKSNLTIERKISTREDSPVIQVMDTVSNKNTFDYPTLHVQHPTIGPPFLDAKNTIVDIPSSQSIVFPYDFGAKHPLLKAGEHFKWPKAPLQNGDVFDLRYPLNPPPAAALTMHLLSSENPSWFTAINTKLGIGLVYLWNNIDFPWIVIWDEYYNFDYAPWNSKGHARGIEFGNTPFGGPKREIIDRGKIFNTPTYRWIDAKSSYQTCFIAGLFKVPAKTKGTKTCKINKNNISIELIEGTEIQIPAFELKNNS